MFDLDKYIQEIDRWHTPATDYPEKEIGNFRIHRGRYTRGMYEMWGVDGYIFNKVTKPIPITHLQERRGKRWHDWMIDDPPHYRAMQIYAEQAKGKVLTTGLGLGLIVHELAKNPKVEQVTVVEKSAEVVRLLDSNLPAYCHEFVIIIDDFYDFIETDHTDWDTIIVDLWVADGGEQKRDLLFHKVLPMGVELKLKYPKASITFHGFQGVSDIKPVSEEMVKLITKVKGR